MNITQCSQSKTAFQTVTSEGARYHNLWFCDWYIHTTRESFYDQIGGPFFEKTVIYRE